MTTGEKILQLSNLIKIERDYVSYALEQYRVRQYKYIEAAPHLSYSESRNEETALAIDKATFIEATNRLKSLEDQLKKISEPY